MVSNITKQVLISEVKQFIIDNFLFGSSLEISDDDSFMNRGIIDSTGILELIVHLETNYHIKIEDTELIPDNLDSLNNVADFVMRKMA